MTEAELKAFNAGVEAAAKTIQVLRHGWGAGSVIDAAAKEIRALKKPEREEK